MGWLFPILHIQRAPAVTSPECLLPEAGKGSTRKRTDENLLDRVEGTAPRPAGERQPGHRLRAASAPSTSAPVPRGRAGHRAVATSGQYLRSLGAVSLSAWRRPGHSQGTSWARFLPEHTDWNAACDCLTAESIPRSLPPNLLLLFSQGNWKQSRPRKGPK